MPRSRRNCKSSTWKSFLIYGAVSTGLAFAVACSTSPKSRVHGSPSAAADESSGERAAPTAPVLPLIVDVADMNNGRDGRASVDPCDDFYQYSCGAWLEKTKIPSDKKMVSRQVTAASDATDIILNKILVSYGRGDFSVPSKYAMKLSDFYNSCLAADDQTPEALAAIKRQIAVIRLVKTDADRARMVAHLKMQGTDVLFSFFSEQDPQDSTKVVGMVGQGGLGLPTRDFYFDQDAKSIDTREKYKAYMSKIFVLLGETPVHAESIAKQVFDFETRLAEKAYSATELRDISKNNHPTNQVGLRKLAPEFDWATYFSTLGVGKLNDLNVKVPQFITAENKIVQTTPKDVLANYFIWQLVDSVAAKMGSAFATANFDFRGRYMTGAKEREPLWKRCTGSVASNLDYPLADAYVQTFDGDKIREKAEGMIVEIKRTFVDDLRNLNKGPDAWMDDKTIKGAIEKVGKVSQKVGAPSKFIDFTSVQITPLSYLQNYLHVAQFEARRDIAKIGKPVDKTEWGLMPWEINAYYERSNNEFVFPFGILQPPAFDLAASDGINYGAFGGGTIGHELTHGFDKDGSKYDLHGNLKDWWTPETQAKFTARAECYENQASEYHIDATNMNVNGKLTIDENLADQGGVKLGIIALDRILSHRAIAADWHGYNERQQYWISYAQSWCAKMTDEAARNQMLTNEHPLNEFRVNQVLRNRPEFARDFNCKVGSRMAPVKKCSLW